MLRGKEVVYLSIWGSGEAYMAKRVVCVCCCIPVTDTIPEAGRLLAVNRAPADLPARCGLFISISTDETGLYVRFLLLCQMVAPRCQVTGGDLTAAGYPGHQSWPPSTPAETTAGIPEKGRRDWDIYFPATGSRYS